MTIEGSFGSRRPVSRYISVAQTHNGRDRDGTQRLPTSPLVEQHAADDGDRRNYSSITKFTEHGRFTIGVWTVSPALNPRPMF